MKFSLSLLLASVISLMASALPAHEDDAHDERKPASSTRVLGKISFPTSTQSEQAQKAFIDGMLLLHLFEYPFAQEKFHQAQQLDPGFVMAYWGEAMTHNHPIWDEQEQDAALTVLARLGDSPEARKSRTFSQKEKEYLAAMDILYGKGPKAARDVAYMQHMQVMATNYPQDDEVQLFYAMSIFGAHAGVRDIPAYMQITAIAQRVFYANRQHPGAAHYMIHGVDDPVHAPLGLEAARALAIIAPDAGHSQHMTSHIFTAVGMWDDVVSANKSAVAVQNQMRVSRDQPARHWGHYNFWLLYGLLQQGRHDEAANLLRAAHQEAVAAGAVPEDPLVLSADRSQIGSVVQMWARYMIETGGKDREMAKWTFNMADAFDPNLTFHYVLAMDAASRETPALAEHHLEKFRQLKSQLREAIMAMDRKAPTDLLYLDRLEVLQLEMQATIAHAAKDASNAIRLAREASRREGEMPYAFGPPFIDLPSAELLGNILLDNGDYDGAKQAFSTQQQRTRRKAGPMLGLARAQAASGELATAERSIKMLSDLWENADPAVKEMLKFAR